MYWALMGAWVMICLWVASVYPQRVNKGYISRAHMRIARKIYKRPAEPTWRYIGCWLIGFFVVMWSLTLVLVFVVSMMGLSVAHGEFWIVAIIREFDDVLNGEDDAWKKRWDSVKNKVKWKWTPAMEPVRNHLGS